MGGGRGDAVCLEDGEDVLFGKVEAEGFKRDFELVVVDVVVFVQVEEGELVSIPSASASSALPSDTTNKTMAHILGFFGSIWGAMPRFGSFRSSSSFLGEGGGGALTASFISSRCSSVSWFCSSLSSRSFSARSRSRSCRWASRVCSAVEAPKGGFRERSGSLPRWREGKVGGGNEVAMGVGWERGLCDCSFGRCCCCGCRWFNLGLWETRTRRRFVGAR